MLEFFELLIGIDKQYEGKIAYIIIIIASILYGIRYILKNSSFSLKRYLEQLLNKKEAKHKEAVEHRKKIMPIIKEELSYLAKEIGADRVLVYEFSNGNSNVVGLPFLYLTATSEVTTLGTDPIAHTFQRINTCLFADFIAMLEEKTYIYIDNLETIKEVFPVLYTMYASKDTKTILFYSLYGREGSIGFISASTIKNNAFSKDIGLPRIAQISQQISTLVNFNELHEQL